MNWITILGYVLVTIGTLGTILFASNHFELSKKIFLILTTSCVIVIGIGTAFSSTIGPNKKASDKDVEYKSEMEKYRSDLDSIKAVIGISDSSNGFEIDHIIKLDKDFENWANNFLEKKDSLRLSIHKSNIKIEEGDLYLNKQWRPVYNNLFEHIRNMLSAYNSKVNTKIIYDIPSFPDDLISYFEDDWIAEITFNEKRAWAIRSYSYPEPSVIPLLPPINVFIASDFYTYSPPEISISINPNNREVSIVFKQDEIKVPGFKIKYDLDDNPNALKEIFQKLIEYELAQL